MENFNPFIYWYPEEKMCHSGISRLFHQDRHEQSMKPAKNPGKSGVLRIEFQPSSSYLSTYAFIFISG